MSTTQGGPSPEHQRLVRSLVDCLNNNGWTVTHAYGIGAYSQPFDVGGRIPDVIAQDASGLLAFG